MSKYRQAARIDNNQREIVKELRQIPGVTVVTGHDDILVGHRGKTYWFELKNPDKIKKSGKLQKSAIKESQRLLLDNYTGHYQIVWNLEQILEVINGQTT